MRLISKGTNKGTTIFPMNVVFERKKLFQYVLHVYKYIVFIGDGEFLEPKHKS